MAWFYDTFLPSLFERAGAGGTAALTVKQSDICKRYMHISADRKSLTCKLDERTVNFYGNRKGTGALYFAELPNERAARIVYNEKSTARKTYNHDKKWYSERIGELRGLLEDIAADLRDGMISAEQARKESAELNEKLAIWLSVAE